MPHSTTRSELDGLWNSVEVVVEAEGEGGQKSIDVVVPKESKCLVLTLTGNGPTGYLRGPVAAECVLIDPEGRNRSDLIRPGPAGQLIIFADNPTPGRWTANLAYGAEGNAELNVTVIETKDPGKLKRLGRFLRCKSCKIGLKAAIIALLAHLVPLLASGLGVAAAVAQLGAALGGLIAAIESVFGIGHAALVALGEAISEVLQDPLDVQVERACKAFRMCRA